MVSAQQLNKLSVGGEDDGCAGLPTRCLGPPMNWS